jgi:hypothetical protein
MKWLPTAARSPTTCLPESLKGFQESILGDPRTNSCQFYYQVVEFIEIPNRAFFTSYVSGNKDIARLAGLREKIDDQCQASPACPRRAATGFMRPDISS